MITFVFKGIIQMQNKTITSDFIRLAPIPVCIIDSNNLKLEAANEQFLDLVNENRAEIQGKHFGNIIGQDVSLFFPAFLLQLTEAPGIASLPIQIPELEASIAPFSGYSYFASAVKETSGESKIAVWLMAKTARSADQMDVALADNLALGDAKTIVKRPSIEYIQMAEENQFNTPGDSISLKASTYNPEQDEMLESWTELERSREWFKNMVHSSPVAMLITKGENMVFDVINEPMLNLIGRDASVLGKTWFEAIPELVGQHVVDELFYAYRTGLTHHVPAVGITLVKNGESMLGYYDLTYTPLKENGQVVGLMQTATEVTEYVKSKDKLQKAYEQIRLSKEAAELGTFDMDMVTGRLEWDDRCRLLFGISHSDEVEFERDFLQNLHPEDLDRINSVLAYVFDKQASNGIYDIEYRTIGYEDKRLRWIRAKGQVYFDVHDKPLRFIGSVLDITEQKEDEQRKNDFIGMASHELKTPLTSINAYLQLLQHHANRNQESTMLATIEKSLNQVKRMTRMIDGFLNVSRLESGKIAIDKQAFEITALLKEVREETVALTTGYPVNLSVTDEVMVYADRNKIGQVLQNLLGNAFKYSMPGSEVKMSYLTENDHITISVTDQGIGIKPEHQQKLFERYYRVESNSTISGFGIGLYLCAEIIIRHQGKIWVDSEFGKGSTFSFRLPLN
ncbi:PAS domain-containing sensor histidine kinase [Pedobacter kyungheensis]|uniref:PAS domain-containing sensor histidine kinase n=1 Tax=Pedobacter kyungheensis TaxID=1069985 RepID=UPI00068A9763|nr:ATP-binding protein [Pedobacter kyungheensis]